MITTWQVLSEGTQTFTPIIHRMLWITDEMLDYFLWISLGILWITLIYKAVIFIINYLEKKNKLAFYTYEYRSAPGEKEWEVYVRKEWKKRKKPNWRYFRNFK